MMFEFDQCWKKPIYLLSFLLFQVNKSNEMKFLLYITLQAFIITQTIAQQTLTGAGEAGLGAGGGSGLFATANLNANVELDVNSILDEVHIKTYVNEENFKCWFNEWRARDQECRIMGTYKRCRFSRQSYMPYFRIPNGRWYCCYTRFACSDNGQKLDH